MTKDPLELEIVFTTDRFRSAGLVDSSYNAGNSFYGEDVAKWICELSTGLNLDYMDEDWGWLVSGLSADDYRESILVNYIFNNGVAEWHLIIMRERKKTFLRYFKMYFEVPYSKKLGDILYQELSNLGVVFLSESHGVISDDSE